MAKKSRSMRQPVPVDGAGSEDACAEVPKEPSDRAEGSRSTRRSIHIPFIIAFAILFFMLFLAVLSAVTTDRALGLLSGKRTVVFWNVAVGLCAVAWAYCASGVAARSPLRRIAAAPDVWARCGIVLVFLLYLNVFVHSLFTAETWGLVTGHDQPQYYMQMHSFLFDFDARYENEYDLMPAVKAGMAEWQPTDPFHNVAPIGSALLWMPFYIVAHLCVLGLRAGNALFVANGVSAPYAMAAAFGSNALVLLGMLMLYQTLRRWVSARAAFMTILVLYFASNLSWYLTGEVWMSHAPSFFAACLVFYVWVRLRPIRRVPHWLMLGAAIGVAMLVRPSHFVLLLLPLVDAFVQWREKRPGIELLKGIGAMLGALVVVLSPQLLVWSIRGTEGSPMEWDTPALVAILFSSHRGLFAWHPIAAVGALGLPLLWRRCRSTTIALALLLIAYWYTNAAIGAWSAGASFGMRRFVGALPFLAPGIALAGSWLVRAVQRHAWTAAVAVLIVLGVYNHFLLVLHRGFWVDPGSAVAWRTVWSNIAALGQDYYGHPFSIPANWWFAAKYDAAPTQYDLLGSRLHDGVPLDLKGQLLRAHLGRGWHRYGREDYQEASNFSAIEKDCSVLLPLKADKAYRIELEIAVPTELPNPQKATFEIHGESIAEVTLKANGWNQIPLAVPGRFIRDGINTLEIHFTESKERTIPRGSVYIGGGIDILTATPWQSCGLLRAVRVTPDT